MSQLAWWDASNDGPNLSVLAVNLSARQLDAPETGDTVRTVLERYGIAPGRVELEITESAVMGSSTPCGVQAQESDVAWSEDCRMDGRVPRGCKRSSAIDREMRRELRRRLCVAGGVRMVLHRHSTRSFEPHPDRPRHVRSSSDRVLAQNSAEAIDSLNLQ
jgi:hypothetical protein